MRNNAKLNENDNGKKNSSKNKFNWKDKEYDELNYWNNLIKNCKCNVTLKKCTI